MYKIYLKKYNIKWFVNDSLLNKSIDFFKKKNIWTVVYVYI